MADQDVVGVLLVGGASRRFGSPKAVARLGGETLAERAYRTLEQAFDRAIVVGKSADRLPLPFPVLDDESDVRAAIVGVAAGIRLAGAEVCVFLPTDVPWITPDALRSLAEAATGADAAVPTTGPLPGAYRRSALPVLEHRIDAGVFALRDALKELETRIVEVDPELLVNVNEPADLERISGDGGR